MSAAELRVATLLPFVSQALSDAAPSVVVVASVRRNMNEPPPEGVIDLGSAHSPNVELLAQARPDVVVADSTLHAMLGPKLERSVGEVLLLDTTSVASTFASLQRLGDRVGVGEALAAKIEDAEGVLEATRLASPAQALVLFGTPGSFFVMTERAWLGDLMTRLGFELLGADAGSERMPGFVAVSDELLVTLRPDRVFLISHGDPNKIRLAFDRKLAAGGPWAQLDDRSQGVHVLAADRFGANPGLDIPVAAQELLGLMSAPDAAARSGSGG